LVNFGKRNNEKFLIRQSLAYKLKEPKITSNCYGSNLMK